MSSSRVDSYRLDVPSRLADRAIGTTSPEEFIAAAHSSCYAMQLSGMLQAEGGRVVFLDVEADVSMGIDEAGALRLTRVALHVRGAVEGVGEEVFLDLAEVAKENCPVSRALTGVQIDLDAALETSSPGSLEIDRLREAGVDLGVHETA